MGAPRAILSVGVLAAPAPMLSRAVASLRRGRYAFEPKWDGFRAIVSNGERFRVLSRRGWHMTALVPELAPARPLSASSTASFSPSAKVSLGSPTSAGGSSTETQPCR
jgi:hypothetical protein